ncbi:MAG: HAD-IIB family hydrolase [Rectinemataceae bacterium]|nr:HAD-IIB family hydrolase [Rectinemataceae bacterium]
MKPISSLTSEQAQAVRFVLMDIDDTLTTEGKLPAESYAALWQLKEAGFVVVPITGRPAGWCDLIAREWPVDGVVGENGAFVFWEEAEGRHLKTLVHPAAVRNDAPALARALARAQAEVPGCRPARDQFARLYDIAIDFAEEEPVLPLSDALKIKAICEEEGARAKVSSIHVNAWMGDYDKLGMARRYLAERYGYDDACDRESVVFVGDSPNDEPMFAHFPLACGVANVIRYTSMMKRLPAFIASKEGGVGFAEIADTLLALRSPARDKGNAKRIHA